MAKKEELIQLDDLVRARLIKLTRDGDTAALGELTPAINYLRNNQVVSDKPKSTIEEDTKKRLEQARKRRAKGDSK